MPTPRVEINLSKIKSNLRALLDIYGKKSISICAVTKVVCGNVDIARVLVKGGIKIIADSRLNNIKKMHHAGVRSKFMLLGPPKVSEIDSIVRYAHISLNTELSVIQKLSASALVQGVEHQVILMIECGDLREGVLPENIELLVTNVLPLKGIKLVGIGTNLGCFSGVQVDQKKMDLLSNKALEIEKKFGIQLQLISGGNSANYNWFSSTKEIGKINNLRLGESIFLGRETVGNKRIPTLFIDAFTLVTEVTELKSKPSLPYGKKGGNTFGKLVILKDIGIIKRAILSIGQQDVHFSGLSPKGQIKILGGSSDHLLIDPKQSKLTVGSEVRFNLNYSALLSLMTSPYVHKTIIPIK